MIRWDRNSRKVIKCNVLIFIRTTKSSECLRLTAILSVCFQLDLTNATANAKHLWWLILSIRLFAPTSHKVIYSNSRVDVKLNLFIVVWWHRQWNLWMFLLSFFFIFSPFDYVSQVLVNLRPIWKTSEIKELSSEHKTLRFYCT